MIQASSIEELNLDKACLTIGSFDGVHIGHQSLISTLVTTAHKNNCPAVVLTFHPHPVVVLKRITTPYYISSPAQKAQFLSNMGVDILITLPFTHAVSQITAENFTSLLVKHLGLHTLVVGCGFVLGKNRGGTVDVLANLGRSSGFSVNCLEPVLSNEEVVSSSLIRLQLETGDVQAASKGLGRFFCVQGKVIRGDGRGHKIGFPTANLDVWSQQLLPSPGVYRCLTTVNGRTFLSVGNLGYRPTFTDNTHHLFTEIHLLDFSSDIYGEEVQVQFTHRLRGEIKYSSFEDLITQIHRDIITARNL